MKQGREDLAETAVARLMDVEAQVPVLEATIAQANEAEAELEGYIAALQARKREMQAELRSFREAQATTGDGPPGDGTAGGGALDQAVRRAESTFDRVLESASMVPGSGTQTDRKSASQMAELDELARQNRIKERLASLKAEAKV